MRSSVTTMRIDLYASLGHYADHLWPIWKALPAALRGESYAGNGTSWWGDRLPARYRPTDRLVLVAGFVDVQRLGNVPIVYVEHGAGQSYTGDPKVAVHASYPGGRHPANVVGYLCPAERVARQWWGRGAAVGVVGCPRLDPWLSGARGDPGRRTLALTFHWNCEVTAESRSALPHYRRALPGLIAQWRAQGWEVLGHGHPRAWGQMNRLWHDLGVEAVRESARVLDRAGLLIADNTSLLYEFAALDRPVVALNAPWYRRDVHHGLRFWNLVPGVQCDGPDDLAGLDLAGQVDLDPEGRSRRIVVGQVYSHSDGSSGQRSADWLAELMEDRYGDQVHGTQG